MNLNHKTNYKNGDTFSAEAWNKLAEDVNELGQSEGTSIDTDGIISVNNKGNVTIGSNNIKNVNIEPGYPYSQDNTKYGDIALKPGDDIQFASHHREPKKRDKIVIKNIDGSDNPVKLQVVTGEIDLATGTQNNPKTATRKKDSNTGEDIQDNPLFKPDEAKVMNVRILTGNVIEPNTKNEREERGYLKVRAQAIDLRCEKHGGIALQPKGYDDNGNMNKIKFEHGGGDGLEFGTFNTEKTSIFTNEYRFNKDGVWKMAVRETELSNKNIVDEKDSELGNLTPTGKFKYKKNNSVNNASKSNLDQKSYEPADDFYDFIDTEDPQTTTKDIIQTSASFNNDYIETSLSSKKNLKISSISDYKIVSYQGITGSDLLTFSVDKTRVYKREELKTIISSDVKLSDYIETGLPFYISNDSTGAYCIEGNITPKIVLESEEEVDIDAKYGDVVLTSGDTIKMEAPEIRLNALNPDKSGGFVNFGATQDVVFLNTKLTKSLNIEAPQNPTQIKLLVQNNYQEPVIWDNVYKKFRIRIKHLYLDDQHTTELTPTNYVKEVPVYFSDGTRVPADYTCYIAAQSGTTTSIYKVGTKGSEAILKKNLGDLVATYVKNGTTSEYTSSLGKSNDNTLSNIEFEDYDTSIQSLPATQISDPIQSVAAGESVTLKEVSLNDIVDLVNWMKTNNEGPWKS